MVKNRGEYRLVSFDMDGTLTRGTTALQYFASQLGQSQRAAELEHLYKTKVLDDQQVAEAYAALLKGVSIEQFGEWMGAIPKVDHITEVVANLHNLKLMVGIVSVGPRMATEALEPRDGFDFVSGSWHEFKDGVHMGRMIKVMSGADKVEVLTERCEEYGYTMDQVIAVGDSRSDVDIFERVGYAIAFNADYHLWGKADEHVESNDLMDVYALIARLLNC
jgi:phosphoserine phosphatase